MSSNSLTTNRDTQNLQMNDSSARPSAATSQSATVPRAVNNYNASVGDDTVYTFRIVNVNGDLQLVRTDNANHDSENSDAEVEHIEDIAVGEMIEIDPRANGIDLNFSDVFATDHDNRTAGTRSTELTNGNNTNHPGDSQDGAPTTTHQNTPTIAMDNTQLANTATPSNGIVNGHSPTVAIDIGNKEEIEQNGIDPASTPTASLRAHHRAVHPIDHTATGRRAARINSPFGLFDDFDLELFFLVDSEYDADESDCSTEFEAGSFWEFGLNSSDEEEDDGEDDVGGEGGDNSDDDNQGTAIEAGI
ncbi:hypothetical protein EYZ11_001874 [Aspergillus tanneri]|nr:hypothetical protein EYZ11_001874 [Aspergillus tanneri]